ncbi:hypothetical protein [Kineococcus glutinatus]|uniref:DUF423 domain-containing protein n=1 Tax=Kineococcus glutinatus TaxID=1070872 RepID=A0ABP9HTX6_9ACTN
MGLAGLLAQNATFAGVVATRIALASLDGVQEAVVAGLWALHDALFALNGAFLATALVGLSLAGRRTGLIRPWHAALGLLSAALLFTSGVLAPVVVDGAPTAGLAGLLGWLLWVVWVTAYGVVLLRRPAPA